jgi:hypothetical protein
MDEFGVEHFVNVDFAPRYNIAPVRAWRVDIQTPVDHGEWERHRLGVPEQYCGSAGSDTVEDDSMLTSRTPLRLKWRQGPE